MNQAAAPLAVADLIACAYAAFNARDVDAVLATLHADVDWPNLIDGGRLHGHNEVRGYWTHQFATTDPHVEPGRLTTQADGRVAVAVHQVVRTRDGTLVDERDVQHIYTLREGLVARMDVEAAQA